LRANTDAGWHELMIARIAITIELAAVFFMVDLLWACHALRRMDLS
jgi:hypothetical protein